MDKKSVNIHEKKLAKQLGGTRVPMSGALDSHKGDIRVGNFLIDDKSTSGKSISVTKDMLVKISKEAREVNKTPVLSLSFEKMGLAGDTWFMIPMWKFQELLDESCDV